MVSLKSFVVILGLSTSAFAKPPARWGSRDAAPKSTVYEKVAAPPVGWTQDKDQKLDKDATTIKLRIHLIQQDMDKFHEMALNVSSLSRLCSPNGIQVLCHRSNLNHFVSNAL